MLSCLLCKALAREGCQLEEDTWKMVPGKHLASARDKQLITILKSKLDKKVERLMHMNLVVTEITIRRNLHFLTDILKT